MAVLDMLFLKGNLLLRPLPGECRADTRRYLFFICQVNDFFIILIGFRPGVPPEQAPAANTKSRSKVVTEQQSLLVDLGDRYDKVEIEVNFQYCPVVCGPQVDIGGIGSYDLAHLWPNGVGRRHQSAADPPFR